MWLKNKRKPIAVNLASIVLSSALLIYGGVLKNSQHTQFSYKEWESSEKKLACSQVSAFFTDNSDFSTDTLNNTRSSIQSKITDASLSAKENTRLWYDSCYSRFGKASVTGNTTGRQESEINVVNSDFFLLHKLKLVNGAFFSDSDIMHDYAVIDELAAWKLFGSSDVCGMTININNVTFYISGVTETPKNKIDKKCYGKYPQIYISYEGASSLCDKKYTDIDCYEAVLPQPVKKFASSAFKSALEEFSDDAVILENTNRFSFFKRLKALKKIENSVANEKPVIFPWWEKSARITEFRLSFIYFFSLILLIIPFINLIKLLVRLYKASKEQKTKAFNSISNAFDKFRTRKYRKEHTISDISSDTEKEKSL